MADLPRPPALAAPEIDRDRAEALLAGWGHPRPGAWLDGKLDAGAIAVADEALDAADLWRELLKDECDKLYNQAWCALEQIREAADESEVMMLAVDDFPSAVEQAFSLAPALATEHLDLLKSHRYERYEVFAREMGLGTARETAERIECLAFWEANADGLSRLRKTLFRLVRKTLEA